MAYNFEPDAYAGAALDYLRFRPPYPDAQLARIFERVGPTGGSHLLDLACGPGRVCLRLAPRFAQVTAVDLDAGMLQVASDEAVRLGLSNVRFLRGRVEETELDAGAVDVVTMGDSFHRFDQRIVIPLLRRWIRPGGYVVAMGGDWDAPSAWHDAYAEIVARWQPPGALPAHPHARQPELTSGQILADAGFTDVTEEDFTVPHVWSVATLVGNAFSTSSMSRHALGDRAQGFEAEVRERLLALHPDDRFPDELCFWLAIGRR